MYINQDNLDIQSLKQSYELIEHFIENVNDFLGKEEVSSKVKENVTNLSQHIRLTYEDLKSLIALPPTEENIFNMATLLKSISLREMWDIDDIMQKEIQQINVTKRSNEQKIIAFIKESISNKQNEISSQIETLRSENENLTQENIGLNNELEDLKEHREEMEKLPTTCGLMKKENPFRRFMRIMTEKPDLWTEVEVGDKIILRNSDGEIRGEVQKEDEENTEAIVKTEKEIIKKRKKYSIFQRLKNLTKSQVFTVEPSIREQKLNMNYLDMAICRGKIENNTKRITENLKRIERIDAIFRKFADRVTAILENCKNKESMQIISEIIDEITAVNILLNEKSNYIKIKKPEKIHGIDR